VTGEGQWTAIRIAYHDADKTPLLVGAIGPIVEKLRDFGASRAIFKPHWRRGPHVDFGLQLDPSATGAGFPERARQAISAWIEANPSTAALDSVPYLQLSMKLATAEGAEGPFLPLLANNSLTALADDRFPPPPDDALAGIRDRFQADTLPLLVQLARLKDDRARFWGTLAEMMMCVAQFSGPAGMRGGHISYRSHAEGFLSGAPPLRPRFEDFSNELSARTISGIEGVRDAFAPDGSFRHSDPLLEAWVKHVRTCKDALDRATSAMSAETLLIHSSVTVSTAPFARTAMNSISSRTPSRGKITESLKTPILGSSTIRASSFTV